MPYVTTTARTFDILNFPPDARLQIIFRPSEVAVAPDRIYPLEDVVRDVPTDGVLSVNLADTSKMFGNVYYEVGFQWLAEDSLLGARRVARAWLKGELRVPAGGGDLMELLERSNLAGIILAGFGAPPEWLENVIYWDVSGVKPVLYAPLGAIL